MSSIKRLKKFLISSDGRRIAGVSVRWSDNHCCVGTYDTVRHNSFFDTFIERI